MQFLLSIILQWLIKEPFSKVTHDNKSSILSVIMSHIHNTVKYICMQFFLALSDNLTNLYIYIYYAMLSHFSHVQLCVTP